jgi:hypothetical protein
VLLDLKHWEIRQAPLLAVNGAAVAHYPLLSLATVSKPIRGAIDHRFARSFGFRILLAARPPAKGHAALAEAVS